MDQRSKLKELIARGKDQGYLTYAEVNDHLPAEIADPEQIEDIIVMINEMGIKVTEIAPEAEELLLSDNEITDEVVADEVASALMASINKNSKNSEFGSTTDTVRMYMREMGSVELLSREGEIAIARRIEEGNNQMLSTLASQPQMIAEVLADYAKVTKDEMRLAELISGYVDSGDVTDPNAVVKTETTEKEDIATETEDEETEGESEGDGGSEFPEDTGPDPELARIRFQELQELYDAAIAVEKKTRI